MDYTKNYLTEISDLIDNLDPKPIEKIVELIRDLKQNGGRIFFIGVGGSAANCSHAVNDFRKISEIECYAPTDNVAELTARTNDDGWERVFRDWFTVSKLKSNDLVFVLSVGGGGVTTSRNIINGVSEALACGAKVCGIVGRNGGFTALNADACVLIPTVNEFAVTPYVESIQSLLLHLIVNHPGLK